MMQKFIKLFVIYILLYFIFSTFLVHNGYVSQTMMAISKEILRFWFVLWSIIYYRKYFFSYTKLMYIYYVIFAFVVLVWLGVTWIYQPHDIYMYSNMIIWLKYGLLFMGIMVSASWLWYIYKSEKFDISQTISLILQIFIYSLAIWLIWQSVKFVRPHVFTNYLGYGPVGDFDFGNPPIYYRTWPGGIPRYNGLFAWPNNLWFILVLLWSVVLFAKNLGVKLRQKLLYVIICGIVMSRGLIVWVLVQTLIYIYMQKEYRRYMFAMGSVCILWIVWLSIYKRWSTMDHLSLFFASFDKFLANIWWYGLGSSGPAVHWHGTILPENFYLQIMIDFGIVWFVWFLSWWSVYIYKQYQLIRSDYIYMLLSLGLIWLFVEGLFLHVWEDSMVNYVFMIMYGMSWGYSLRK